MRRTEFEKLINEAKELLTPKGKELLNEVTLVLEKTPAKLFPHNCPSGWVLGCFTGSRKNQSGLYPPVITLFQDDLEFANRFNNREGTVTHISQVLAHELVHYLGADEETAQARLNIFLEEYAKPEVPEEKSWWQKILDFGKEDL